MARGFIIQWLDFIVEMAMFSSFCGHGYIILYGHGFIPEWRGFYYLVEMVNEQGYISFMTRVSLLMHSQTEKGHLIGIILWAAASSSPKNVEQSSQF